MSVADHAVVLLYRPRGASRELFAHREPEVVLSGPAGTGKSRSILEKMHLVALRYPNARILLARKTRRSLTESALVTYEQKVLHPLDGVRWEAAKQRYAYPNGAIVAVGGLDKPGKIMSSEWDLIVIPEATELDENDWEALTTRLRNGRMPYQQIIGDCNPSAPTHWLKQRADAAKATMLESRHEDNPLLYDESGALTETGRVYISKLDALSGVRKLRLRYGQWAAAEGMVYEGAWDAKYNLVERAVVSTRPHDLHGDCGLPRDWPRYLGIDFGFRPLHPFVCRWYAEDGDGRLWMYREIYYTERLVEDHAKDIRRWAAWGAQNGDPLPRAIVTDHDAEDRATLERHLGLRTIPAHKTVSDGIQQVASRFRLGANGKPGLIYLKDSLVERDPKLVEAKYPTCGAEEVESYVWEIRAGGKYGDAPVKENDHAMDVDRYVVAHLDLVPRRVKQGPRLF